VTPASYSETGAPIGVFDSGIGGLTVVRELFRHAPREAILYFGDTARVPYGTKSPAVVRVFARQDARFLLTHRVKMIVVACHTVSSIALDELSREATVPVLGVVEPGIRAGLDATRNGRIGVIGTRATVLSGAYERGFKALRPDLRVFTQACPLFVPLVEEGWLDEDVTVRTAEKYLAPVLKARIDTLVLGCTHYPLLKPVLHRLLGDGVTLIDSAEETAKAVRARLDETGLASDGPPGPEPRFFVSDIPHHFRSVGALCLGRDLRDVSQVDLEAMHLAE
jgi:glutamate racemase